MSLLWQITSVIKRDLTVFFIFYSSGRRWKVKDWSTSLTTFLTLISQELQGRFIAIGFQHQNQFLVNMNHESTSLWCLRCEWVVQPLHNHFPVILFLLKEDFRLGLYILSIHHEFVAAGTGWELLSRQRTALQEVEFSFHFYHSQCHMVLTFLSLPFLMIQIRS